MNRTLLAALAALAAPIAAQAQQASSTVTVTGEVAKACMIGQPTTLTLNLGDLTGPDGRVSATLASSAPAATTTISDAWCNAPSTLSLNGEPMSLSPAPPYSTPVGFARLVTYDATLTGWPTSLVDRPLVGDAAKTATAPEAHGTPSLELKISGLGALNAAGSAANTDAVLEAGSYSGAVVIGVTVQ